MKPNNHVYVRTILRYDAMSFIILFKDRKNLYIYWWYDNIGEKSLYFIKEVSEQILYDLENNKIFTREIFKDPIWMILLDDEILQYGPVDLSDFPEEVLPTKDTYLHYSND